MDTTATLPPITLTLPADAIDEISMSFRAHQKIEALTVATLKADNEALKAERAAMVDVLQLGETDNPAIAVGALVTERDNALSSYTAASEQIQQLSDHVEALTATNRENAALITALQQQLDSGTSDALQVMKERLNALERQLKDKSDLLDTANRTISGQQVTNEKQSSLLREALAKLAKYEPVPVPPSTIPASEVPPVTNMRPVFPFAGGYFEDERTVNTITQAAERAAFLVPSMEFTAANSALTDYIVFCNPIELDPPLIPDTIKRLKKRWWQSPAQNYFIPGAGLNQPKYIGHLKALYKAGVYGFVFDDAHNIAPVDMVGMIDLIELHCPGAPIIASFGAKFDDSAYPRKRYIDCRQWYLKGNEKAANYFPVWDKDFTCDIYTAGTYRAGTYMPTPQKVVEEFTAALPLVQGIAWYTIKSEGTDLIADHKAALAKDAKAFTVWMAIKQCTDEYLKAAKIVAQPA
jgi:uncharacterized coiled-coil protein SlyX